MSATDPVIVGTDGSPQAEHAVRWAAEYAARAGAPLRIVSTVTVPAAAGLAGQLPQEFFDGLDQLGQQNIDEATRIASDAAPEVAVTGEVIVGPTGPTMVELSKEASLLVVGARGRGAVASAVLGSVSSLVTRHAVSPVAVVKTAGDGAQVPSSGPVVVGVDGTEASDAAVGAAFLEASRRGAPLVAVHAWSDMPLSDYPAEGMHSRFDEDQIAKKVLSERLAGQRAEHPDVAVDYAVTIDRPAEAIIEWARGAQLVVVGTRGRGGVAGLLLGSTAVKVLRGAQCPVFVAR